MIRFFFFQHPIDDLDHLSGSSYNGLLFALLSGNPVVEAGQGAILALRHVNPSTLDQQPLDGPGSLFRYATVIGS